VLLFFSDRTYYNVFFLVLWSFSFKNKRESVIKEDQCIEKCRESFIKDIREKEELEKAVQFWTEGRSNLSGLLNPTLIEKKNAEM